MAQFGRPDSDVTVSDWTTAPLWSSIDEATFSDADLISSNNNTNNACEVGLSDVGDPVSSSTHVVRYRYRKNAAAGNARNITVSLYQGATLIAEQTHTGISEVFTAGSFTLTGPQADSITDYADLRLRFTAGGTTGGSGGNRRSVQVSWAELEVPDAAVVTLTQTTFRGRNDDGDETGATWKAAAGVDWEQALDENFRVRFLVSSATAAPTQQTGFGVHYSKNGGAWSGSRIHASSIVARTSLSPHVTDGSSTTEQLGGSGTFSPGEIDETDGWDSGFLNTPAVGQDTEIEICLQLLSADLAPGDTVGLRLQLISDGSTLNGGYTDSLVITVAAPAVEAPAASGAAPGSAANPQVSRLISAASGGAPGSAAKAQVSRALDGAAGAAGGSAAEVHVPEPILISAVAGTGAGGASGLLVAREVEAATGSATGAAADVLATRALAAASGAGAGSAAKVAADSGTLVRFGMENPDGRLGGEQTFSAVAFRADDETPDPLVSIEVHEGGVFRATVVDNEPATSITGTRMTGTWDASVLADDLGKEVELVVLSDGIIEVGALGDLDNAPYWLANVVTPYVNIGAASGSGAGSAGAIQVERPVSAASGAGAGSATALEVARLVLAASGAGAGSASSAYVVRAIAAASGAGADANALIVVEVVEGVLISAASGAGGGAGAQVQVTRALVAYAGAGAGAGALIAIARSISGASGAGAGAAARVVVVLDQLTPSAVVYAVELRGAGEQGVAASRAVFVATGSGSGLAAAMREAELTSIAAQNSRGALTNVPGKPATYAVGAARAAAATQERQSGFGVEGDSGEVEVQRSGGTSAVVKPS